MEFQRTACLSYSQNCKESAVFMKELVHLNRQFYVRLFEFLKILSTVVVYQNRVSDFFEHYGSESSKEPLLTINCQGLILVSDPSFNNRPILGDLFIKINGKV